ncbi:acyl-CoA dehydrogenase family protein [Rhodococcus sp. T7]|uniref:acyl-CoA dehydrogenase family protein n=1 Tax=Rhodococcus sp. T7 TaxID=627444 RepID=UPI0013582E3F|nr:acyl-CoA dehydrogenase family protein [Rhodococcus sp. T7]KAF0957114.1 Acyl-CoA dehydrogenase FadE34 [Rhodococcus sp. T7]KAF0958839.1 Acyl-CoA dehydrogenase FadE34 [Rhodococcus sp. T7]
MKLTLDPEQQVLQDTTRRFLAGRVSVAHTRELLAQGGLRHDAAVWKRACGELGLAGLIADPDRGGSGTGLTEASLVLEEFGAVLGGGPVLSVTAAVAALEMAGGDIADKYVSRLVEGEATAAVVLGVDGDFQPGAPAVDIDGGRCRITASCPNVMDAPDADIFVLIVPSDVAARVVIVERGAHGVTIEPVASLDLTRGFADVHLDKVVGDTALLAPGAAEGLRDRMAVLIAAELSGLIRSCITHTTTYAQTRVAFGRVIGSFQSLKHRLADMYCQLELVQSAVRAATWCADSGDRDFAINAAVAMRAATGQAVDISTECLRMTGGVAYTWEHDAHFYVRRAHQDQSLLGGRVGNDERLRELVLA